jgi:energy-coupling factor transporter ATP-binding protein EcfA2
LDLEERKRYYNLCNPLSTLDIDSEQEYILEIDNTKVNGKIIDVRGEHWSDVIVDKILWSDKPENVYFTGHIGSGKTTELKKAIKKLSNKDNNYLPVYIDSSDYFDLHSNIDLSDILTVIVHNVIVAVAKLDNISEEEAFKDGFFARTWHWLNNTDVTLDGFEVGINASKLVFSMKNTPSFREKIKLAMSNYFTRYKQEVINELDRLNKKAILLGKKGILVVLDQLDGNIGVNHKVDIVQESMLELFANRQNLELPVSVIYTVPTFLSTKYILNDLNFLPAIQVIQSNGDPYEDGIGVVKQLVYKRIPKEKIEEILGDDSQKKLRKIILFSGGYLRDLLILLQKIIQNKTYPISNETIDSIFQKKINEYKEFLNDSLKEELRKIHISKNITNNAKASYDLLKSHAILRYNNKNLWFSVHPAIRQLLGLSNNDR